MLSSLLLSMLQQMLIDDKSEQVREAVVKSLAILCLYIEDRDKFSQVKIFFIWRLILQVFLLSFKGFRFGTKISH